MPTAALLNANDPLYNFEHQMAHREYFAVMNPVDRFPQMPYFLDSPPGDYSLPAGDYLLRHQRAHQDFNSTLPSNFANGYYLSTVVPVPPPPPTPPPPPYQQAHELQGGRFGTLAQHILLEGASSPENRSWWTFLNHMEHYAADNAILPLPTTAPTSAGTGPGQADLSNPWWWATVHPTYTGPLW